MFCFLYLKMKKKRCPTALSNQLQHNSLPKDLLMATIYRLLPHLPLQLFLPYNINFGLFFWGGGGGIKKQFFTVISSKKNDSHLEMRKANSTSTVEYFLKFLCKTYRDNRVSEEYSKHIRRKPCTCIMAPEKIRVIEHHVVTVEPTKVKAFSKTCYRSRFIQYQY